MRKICLLLLMFCATQAFAQDKCDTWRYPIRTLTDSSGINWFHMTRDNVTIEELTTVGRPPKFLTKEKNVVNKDRIESEKQMVWMDCYVYKVTFSSKDNVCRLSLSSKSDGTGFLMEAEIPDPDCSYLYNRPNLRETYTVARTEAKKIKQRTDDDYVIKVNLRGVPFWNPFRNAEGAAPNKKQISPVVFIKALN